MKDYQYRFTIEGDPLYRESPILRAAWKVAERVHRHQSRKKIDPSIGYICHPIMAYDLMQQMGVTDPATLGAALLHDVREMSPLYKTNPLRLATDLTEEMMAEYDKQAWHPPKSETTIALERMEAVGTMASLVEQVTNPDALPESKGVTQMKRAQYMSYPAMLIKIADQTANLICHLMMTDGPKFTHSKAVDFAKKARDLVHDIVKSGASAMPEERAQLNRWGKLFDNVYSFNRDLLRAKTPRAQGHVRSLFHKQLGKILPAVDYIAPANEQSSVVRVVAFEKTPFDVPTMPSEMVYKKKTPAADAYEHIREAHEAAFGNPQHGGVASVDLDEQGRVMGFTTWVSPGQPAEHFRNRMQTVLTHFLQTNHHEVITEGGAPLPITVAGQVLHEGRHHRLVEPMDAKEFAFHARFSDAVTAADHVTLERSARDVSRDFFFMPTGGGR